MPTRGARQTNPLSTAYRPQRLSLCPPAPAPANEHAERVRLPPARPPPRQAGETWEHGECFLEPDVRNFGAVASVPLAEASQGSSTSRRTADEVKLGCRRWRDGRVSRVEGGGGSARRGSLPGREQTFASLPAARLTAGAGAGTPTNELGQCGRPLVTQAAGASFSSRSGVQ